jgi:hypothetical protein
MHLVELFFVILQKTTTVLEQYEKSNILRVFGEHNTVSFNEDNTIDQFLFITYPK